MNHRRPTDHRRTLLIAAPVLTGAALLATSPLAAAAPAPPADPPSLVQLCAATGIEEIDEAIRSLAKTDLVGDLAPLVSILVPDSETPEIDASLQLDVEDVRQRLNCDALDDPTPTPTPTPTTPPEPDVEEDVDDPDDDDVQDDGSSPERTAPSRSAQTGGGAPA